MVLASNAVLNASTSDLQTQLVHFLLSAAIYCYYFTFPLFLAVGLGAQTWSSPSSSNPNILKPNPVPSLLTLLCQFQRCQCSLRIFAPWELYYCSLVEEG